MRPLLPSPQDCSVVNTGWLRETLAAVAVAVFVVGFSLVAGGLV